jgi:hypothetical protein
MNVAHALGFSSNLYQFYSDPSTGELYDTEIAFNQDISGRSPAGNSFTQTLSKLRTPHVLGYAMNHYNCSSLDGMELEDYGGAGTAGSHWEKRVSEIN